MAIRRGRAVISLSLILAVTPALSQGGFDPKTGLTGPATQKPLKSLPGPKLDTALQEFKPCCVITSIDESKGIIEARDNKTGQTITIQTGKNKIKPGPSHLPGVGKFRVGETVYRNAAGEIAAATFPIRGSREDNLGNSHRMRTAVTISDNGRLDATTRTWTSEALRGFEGGVVVAVTDLQGNILWTSQLRKYGVNGTAVPGAPSDRTENWTETIPNDALNRAAGIAIIHGDVPTSHLADFLNQVLDDANKVKDIVVVVVAIVGLIVASSG